MRLPLTLPKLATIGGLASLIVASIAIKSWYSNNSIPRIGGSWEIEFETLEASLDEYLGLKVSHRVEFIQDGNRVKGIGEAWSANGELLPMERHRKIEFEGVIEDDELKCSYTFHGKNRSTVGSIKCSIQDDKGIVGTFKSTAANSSGRVKGLALD